MRFVKLSYSMLDYKVFSLREIILYIIECIKLRIDNEKICTHLIAFDFKYLF